MGFGVQMNVKIVITKALLHERNIGSLGKCKLRMSQVICRRNKFTRRLTGPSPSFSIGVCACDTRGTSVFFALRLSSFTQARYRGHIPDISARGAMGLHNYARSPPLSSPALSPFAPALTARFASPYTVLTVLYGVPKSAAKNRALPVRLPICAPAHGPRREGCMFFAVPYPSPALPGTFAGPPAVSIAAPARCCLPRMSRYHMRSYSLSSFRSPTRPVNRSIRHITCSRVLRLTTREHHFDLKAKDHFLEGTMSSEVKVASRRRRGRRGGHRSGRRSGYRRV